MSVILVDQDGVLADFEGWLLHNFRTLHSKRPFIPREERTKFYVQSEYPDEDQRRMEDIYHTPGFFLNLPPVHGAIEGIHALRSLGHTIFICTTPLSVYENCVREKYLWVENHLGYSWTKNIILTGDKTVCRGEFLIDDNPNVTGTYKPTWEHVVFDHPYNRHITDKRRMTWANWQEIFKPKIEVQNE